MSGPSRRLFVRMAMMATLCSAALPAVAGEYLFFGSSRPKMASSRDCPRWTYETKEFDKEADAKAYLQAFIRDPSHGDYHVDLFSARLFVVVFSYPGTSPGNRDCVTEKYDALAAPTREGAIARMEDKARSFKEYYAGAPRVATIWGGEGNSGASAADRVEENDVIVVKNGKVTVVAKVRNRSPDKTAFVTFVVNGNRLGPTALPPGQILTMPLGNDVHEFQRRVKFVRVPGKQKPLDQRLLDSAKETVQDFVIRKGGVQPIREFTTNGGVRG
jgi:hypothetical protein